MTEGRIIIIEGTDGTGKTTLANELAAQAGSRTAVFHAGPPRSQSYISEYVLPLAIATDGWTCICDRWHLGEPVWSHIFGRTPILEYEQLHIVEKRLRAYNVPITSIYLTRDFEDIIIEHAQRDEDSAPALQAIASYEKAIKYSLLYWDATTLTDELVHSEVT